MSTCTLIDGHAFIQAPGKSPGCRAFSEYADIFNSAGCKFLHGSSDVIFDHYPTQSINYLHERGGSAQKANKSGAS